MICDTRTVSWTTDPVGKASIILITCHYSNKQLPSPTSFAKHLFCCLDDLVSCVLVFQFERGAYTTAFAVESIFRFGAAMGKAPEITEQQVIKFTNSIYGRRRANQIRTAARIASALRVLAHNSFMASYFFSKKSIANLNTLLD